MDAQVSPFTHYMLKYIFFCFMFFAFIGYLLNSARLNRFIELHLQAPLLLPSVEAEVGAWKFQPFNYQFFLVTSFHLYYVEVWILRHFIRINFCVVQRGWLWIIKDTLFTKEIIRMLRSSVPETRDRDDMYVFLIPQAMDSNKTNYKS